MLKTFAGTFSGNFALVGTFGEAWRSLTNIYFVACASHKVGVGKVKLPETGSTFGKMHHKNGWNGKTS